MSEEQFRRINERIRERGERPSRVQFEEMVARGAIDETGKVLLRRPEPIGGAAVVGEPKEHAGS